ncbi:MAG: UDP-N-acetylmuramoyl-tripeptide--D-alanyl-D-alanine ligase [Flavobacteriaceae bacterium]
MNIPDLYHYFLKSTGVSTDTRTLEKGNLFFCLKGENFNGNQFIQNALDGGASFVVYDDKKFTPKSSNAIYVENSLVALQALAKHHRNQFDIPVLGLTGSNGKTTTKELINAVLSQNFEVMATHGNLNNHIGVPLTLLRIKSSTQIAIIEMGANHREEIAFLSELARPTLGYITNFGKAHLEGFGGEEGVIKGKSELYAFLKLNDGKALVNGDDEKQLLQSRELNRFVFGKNATVDLQLTINTNENGFCVVHVNEVEMPSQLTGEYNFGNLNAAVAFGVFFELSLNQIKKGIVSYSPTNNRSQWKSTLKNRLLLDAYNANPTSMLAALNAFAKVKGENKVVVLGDMLELGPYCASEHQSIVEHVMDLELSAVFLVGPAFSATRYPSNFMAFKATHEIKAYLEKHAVEGATILLKGSRGIALEQLLDLL